MARIVPLIHLRAWSESSFDLELLGFLGSAYKA
jgi:hypothetical protein